MVAGDRGHVTRSCAKHIYDKDNFSAFVRSRYPKYAKYLHDILDSLTRRFEPWPQWLTNCNNAFNFQNGLVIQERKVSFENHMDCKCGPNPLLEEERNRLYSEFVTLCLNAEQITTKLKAQNPDNPIIHKDVWYELLTNENMNKHCKNVNAFALTFLNRSFNEAVVEVEVANLNDTSTERRPLAQKTTEMLNFISTNGPHPLVCMDLVDKVVNAYFGKNWHFIIHQSNYFV